MKRSSYQEEEEQEQEEYDDDDDDDEYSDMRSVPDLKTNKSLQNSRRSLGVVIIRHGARGTHLRRKYSVPPGRSRKSTSLARIR